MLSRLIVAVSTLACAASETPRDYVGYNFESYLKEFEKSYASFQEYGQRKALFESSLEKVVAHNEEYKSGKHSWFAAINDLADLTSEEFNQKRAAKYHPSGHPVLKLEPSVKGNPAAVDWRDKGAVTPVKNQGGCGSCWAFSATETMESHYKIASGKLLTLAPQTYVNCVENPKHCGGTGGCEGATMELAFNFSVSSGIALESDMPYAGRDEACKTFTPAVKCSGYVKNPVNDWYALETALATKGPQSITVAADSWQLYGGGIFHGCSKGLFGRVGDNTLDHGVQLVGYSADYWIVRNSWGPGWGEKGYIRLSRKSDSSTFIDKHPADGVACEPVPKSQTVGGECGLLFDTSYPTGVTAASTSEVIV